MTDETQLVDGRGLQGSRTTRGSPVLWTVKETADLLRTTPKAVYAMVERRQLPGVTRIGRRVLIRASELLDWLDHKAAPSLKESR
jgi:excisionase family DNA binding protein